jgi:SAM-dependent methyltransferase
MKYSDPREPHARALRDYFAGDLNATLVLHSSAGEHEEIPVSVFFRGPEDFFPFERAALELCRGRVLDVGAGTGVHTLYLQELGYDVCAVELLPEAAEIMRARGARDVHTKDIADLKSSPFDTILLLMNGIGIFGTLDGLDRFLLDSPRLLKPDGQIILDSGPANITGDPDNPAVAISFPDGGGYPGETWIALEYRGEIGPPFRELYADPDTLVEHAVATGWNCEIVFHDSLSGFVARLTRPSL